MKSIIYEEYHIVSSTVDCLGRMAHRLAPHMTRTIETVYKYKIRLIISQSSSIPSFSLLQHHIGYESTRRTMHRNSLSDSQERDVVVRDELSDDRNSEISGRRNQ